MRLCTPAAPAAPPAGGDQIHLTIKDQDGAEVHFRVRHTTVFRSIFAAYCAKKSLLEDHVRFLFDGRRIRASETPEDLDMEEGDAIDAMMEQVGN